MKNYIADLKLAEDLLQASSIPTDDKDGITMGTKKLVASSKVVRVPVTSFGASGKKSLFILQKDIAVGLCDFDKGKLEFPFVAMGVSFGYGETTTASSVNPADAAYTSDVASINNTILNSKIAFLTKDKKKFDLNVSSMVSDAKVTGLKGENVKTISPFIIEAGATNSLEFDVALSTLGVVPSAGTKTAHIEVVLHGYELLER